MSTDIWKTVVVKARPGAVWEFMTDLEKVARCVPGAALDERVDDRTYTGAIAVKIGPVHSTYKGKVVFEHLDTVARTAEIVASARTDDGKAHADMHLTSRLRQVPDGTEVTAVSK